MPELIALVPCERVIIDELLKVPTLVTIMEKVDVQVPQGSEVPANSVAPKEWFVFTIWGKKPGEQPGRYRQVIEIAPPEASLAAKLTIDFDFKDRTHKLQNKLFGFPVGAQGVCLVRVWLESADGTATPTHTYPIEVSHSFANPSTGNLTLSEAVHQQ
jgi:hypothetical protein